MNSDMPAQILAVCSVAASAASLLSNAELTVKRSSDLYIWDGPFTVATRMRRNPDIALRVPTPNVSIIELVFCTKKDLTIKKINMSLRSSSKKQLKGILQVTDEKLVSIDFNHNSNSAIIDTSLTNVVGKNMGKISAWYDNEWGFSCRMIDLVKYISKN